MKDDDILTTAKERFQRALERSAHNRDKMREDIRELLLSKARDALNRMDEPHVDFKGIQMRMCSVTPLQMPCSVPWAYQTSVTISRLAMPASKAFAAYASSKNAPRWLLKKDTRCKTSTQPSSPKLHA